jgi:TPR repeat protein
MTARESENIGTAMLNVDNKTEKAINLYVKAAEGDSSDQFNLAVCYEDVSPAIDMYTKAAHRQVIR